MNKQHDHRKLYLPIRGKFYISLLFTIGWGCFSISVAQPWLIDLAQIVGGIGALLIVAGVAWIPGMLNAFLVSSLLLDRYVDFRMTFPEEAITIIVAAHNEESVIRSTLKYISQQSYEGIIQTIVVDNNSHDNTSAVALQAKNDFEMNLLCITEPTPGKNFALNTALKQVTTPHVITVDADTLLHIDAVKNLLLRLHTAPKNTAAVAGSVLVKNSRENWLTKLQEWDYFLSIASIKRMQGLFQGTLVAQGAFSVYKTNVLKEIGGWPDVIGEDIVLTWKILQKGYRVYYEPKSIAFTDVPTTLSYFAKQRARWARGMIEALKTVKPWEQPSLYSKLVTGIDFVLPFIDFSFVFFWIPGLIAAIFFQKYWIVGLTTLLVLPLNLVSFLILYNYQKKQVFHPLGLNIRKNKMGFIGFLLGYQLLMSPISLYGYTQEFFKMKRVWK